MSVRSFWVANAHQPLPNCTSLNIHCWRATSYPPNWISYSTNPSLLGAETATSYQEDRSPQKILCPGRIPGSESSDPAGINNFLPVLLRNGRPDPHSEQKILVNRRCPG